MPAWKMIHRTGPEHHKLFLDQETKRLAIADCSGYRPEDTDDGTLWVDESRHMKIVDNKRVWLPVTKNGEPKSAYTDIDLALVIRRLTGMEVILEREDDRDMVLHRFDTDKVRSLSELASEAILIQNACNGTAVSSAMHRAMCDLLQHARMRGKGTDWVNGHHITRLYVDKLAALAGMRVDTNMQSYHWCEELAAERNPEGPVAEVADALVTQEDRC